MHKKRVYTRRTDVIATIMFPCSRFHATRNLRRHRTQLPKKPQIVAWNSIICTLCTHLTTWPHFGSQILFNFGACISKHSHQMAKVFNKRGLQNFDQTPYKTAVFSSYVAGKCQNCRLSSKLACFHL